MFLMPLGNCLSLFAVTIQVIVIKYINFPDTVNKQINTAFTKKGAFILSQLKGTRYISC